MADKVAKLLQKLPPKQLRLLLAVIQKIVTKNLGGLDVKALKGHQELYRVRVGNYRIIFTKINGQEPRIISVAKRDEKTYKDL